MNDVNHLVGSSCNHLSILCERVQLMLGLAN